MGRQRLDLPVDQIAWDYIFGCTLRELADRYDCSYIPIMDRLRESGIECRPSGARRQKGETQWKISRRCNSDFFESIDSELVAYWLGFIFADGYINQKDSYLALHLNERDREVLQQFRKDIDSNHPIRPVPQNQAVRLIIYDKKIVNDLVRLGAVQAKSLIIQYPSIPTEFDRHFIRGYLDGDGSWTGARFTFCAQICCGSHVFLVALADKLKSWGVPSHIYLTKGDRAWVLSVFKRKDNIYLFRYLYAGSTRFLERKLKHVTTHMGTDWVKRCIDADFTEIQQLGFIVGEGPLDNCSDICYNMVNIT